MIGRCLLFLVLATPASAATGSWLIADGTGRPPSQEGRGHSAGESIRSLAVPLSPDRAEAFFLVETGRDQMTLHRPASRLILVLRYRTTEIRRRVAECRSASRGSALAPSDETNLELAICNGEYWLTTGAGKVRVRRGDSRHGRIVTSLPLPAGIDRAVPASP